MTLTRRQFLRGAAVTAAAAPLLTIPELLARERSTRRIFLPPRGGWPLQALYLHDAEVSIKQDYDYLYGMARFPLAVARRTVRYRMKGRVAREQLRHVDMRDPVLVRAAVPGANIEGTFHMNGAYFEFCEPDMATVDLEAVADDSGILLRVTQ